MTASLGKGISIAIVGAFFGWQAGLFGTTLDTLNPAFSFKSHSVAEQPYVFREECPVYFDGGFLTRNRFFNDRRWCEEYRDEIGGDLPMRRLVDFLPDIPLWGYGLIVFGAMVAFPALYHFTVGMSVLFVCGWLAWHGLTAII